MISVWHNDQFIQYFSSHNLKDNELHLVARVATNSLELAFQLTNHIDHNWTQNPQVTPVNIKGSVRSTSVGDVMIHNDKCYVIESIGYRELSKTEQAELIFYA